ncbi:hypothetical protein [Gemmatimonas sp.]|jgi:hypothetical protein|uniref:hypothetical protein n=1 Tax=Gemmatimonas sp. TaxID=1962908 RepID=UPI0031BFB4DB|nr:hypothetical protein [Gemmatimonas sp.]
MTPTRPFLAASLTLTVPLALLFAACGDGTPSKDPASGNKQAATGPTCVSLDTTPVGLAVLDYITAADPHPQRFLSAVGTDSALPDDGFKTLQDKGPTYFYTSDPKGQAQVKAKLESAGPYASMLVVYKGKIEAENGNAVTVTLGGHYVGGEHEGKVAPVRQITVRCDSTGWRLPKPITPPAKSAAPATADSAGKP